MSEKHLPIMGGGYDRIVCDLDGTAWVPERTCEEAEIDKFFRGCSVCGYMWEYMYGIGKRTRPNYCPGCGRKVEQ